ncbi:MAG: tRNA 2-thiocytidine biosynthesis protein TtcA [Firmicutes bacterium]|nr:tRNA 2-thiocytidine biosynthesis protein TtcA [Bacillota bacterium]
MKPKEIERSILTNFRKTIFRPFTKAVTDYNLLEDGDRICVCISGGKDSLVLAKCMQEIARHGKKKIECEYLIMNPGYDNNNLQQIINSTKEIGIEAKVVDSTIFSAVKNSGHKSPCYICAKMRRGFLYNAAQELGCNKIALGHHFDDVIETTMLSVLYNGIFNTMLPKLDSQNFPGMQLIRPLYLVREVDIISFVKKHNITCSSCNCPMKKEDSKRARVKEIIKELKQENNIVDFNIFKSAENVEIEYVRGFIKDKKHYNSAEFFDKFH